ncbi:hypothetical protein ACOBQB_15235 [Streptomyces sp. G5(2025)]|uniref:hypothetical protein n=1 Tax=Streptomyces sp. G5(2025) TaxID=3406628 RepID=UPI003C186F23
MHRSTTTTAAAALLVSVAVSATASGCVSVERASRSDTAATAAAPSVPRTDGRSRPQIEQAPAREAPAREALVSVGPPRLPVAQSPAPVARPSAPAPRSEQPRPQPQSQPRSQPPPVRRPPAARPDAGATRPAADVCDLGETYGGWRPGSPEAVICRDMYGR